MNPLERLSAALADRYRLERELGAGGMATVYLADDLRHERKIALKVLRPELAAVIGAERFLKEIKVTANLQHPHILGLIDSGEVDGLLWYAMPFVEGESLRDRLQREKQLPIPDAVRIATEVAGALDYAHRHGVIHRDIKPENILLHDGSALVADFGIALAASTAGTRMTETGMSLGTPHYMSPEQAMGEREITARSDVYALGCITYEMLTGDPPFTGSTAQAIVAKVVTAEPERLSTYRKTVPPHVVEAVHTALQKLPADRHGSARDFAAALSGAAAAGRLVPVAGPQARRRAAWALALVTVAGTAGFFGARITRGGGGADTPVHVQLDPQPAPGFQRATLHAFTFTPDGRAIVFATGGDQRHLYRRSLDQPEAVPLAGTEGAANPFVSPDGRWIGFWADGALRRIPAAGGAGQVLHDLRAAADADGVAMGWGSELGGVNDVVYGATWLPQDTIVFGRFSGGLRAIPADGGTPYALTQPDSGDFAHRLPHALPGGRVVLFTVVQSLTADHTHIEALVLATGERRRLIDDASDARYDASGHLLFARAGAVFAVRFDPSSLEVRGEPSRILPDVMHAVAGNSPGSASGAAQFDVAPDGTLAYLTGGAVPLFTSQLVWIERGGRVDPIDVEPLSYLSPRLSPDGRYVIVAARLPGTANALRLIDVERGTSTVLTRGALFALWMPDGSRLVSAFRGEGGQNIYSIRLDGGGDPELLVGSRHPLWPSSISADGRWLAFVESNPATGNDIWVMNLESGGPARPLLRTAANEMHPDISPDGRWLVYSSDESGDIEVFVRPFDGSGRPVQVSRNGGEAPSWAPDGRTIYYVAPDRRSVLATAVETTNGLRVGRTEVFATGRLATPTPVGGIDVSTDGRRLLMTRRLDTEAATTGLPALLPVPFQIIINARSMLPR